MTQELPFHLEEHPAIYDTYTVARVYVPQRILLPRVVSIFISQIYGIPVPHKLLGVIRYS